MATGGCIGDDTDVGRYDEHFKYRYVVHAAGAFAIVAAGNCSVGGLLLSDALLLLYYSNAPRILGIKEYSICFTGFKRIYMEVIGVRCGDRIGFRRCSFSAECIIERYAAVYFSAVAGIDFECSFFNTFCRIDDLWIFGDLPAFF